MCKYVCKIRIYNSIMKYGWDNHIFEVIEECEKDILLEREQYWLNFSFNAFNTLNEPSRKWRDSIRFCIFLVHTKPSSGDNKDD